LTRLEHLDKLEWGRLKLPLAIDVTETRLGYYSIWNGHGMVIWSYGFEGLTYIRALCLSYRHLCLKRDLWLYLLTTTIPYGKKFHLFIIQVYLGIHDVWPNSSGLETMSYVTFLVSWAVRGPISNRHLSQQPKLLPWYLGKTSSGDVHITTVHSLHEAEHNVN
jgi:hypothetical protein